MESINGIDLLLVLLGIAASAFAYRLGWSIGHDEGREYADHLRATLWSEPPPYDYEKDGI